MKKIQLFLLQGLLSSVPLYTLTAQTTTPSTHYAVETGIVAGHGDYSPFWFTANRQGLSSVKTENGYLRAGIFHSQALGRHFTWKAGLDLATAYNYTSSFVVQQAYADLSYRWLNLSIGSKERTPELRNPKLSTGGLVESNSARRTAGTYRNTSIHICSRNESLAAHQRSSCLRNFHRQQLARRLCPLRKSIHQGCALS